jgi:hypothetical protein
VKRNAENSFLFGLGIGSGVDTALVNGISTAGRGKAEFVINSAEIEQKVMKLFNQAVIPSLSELRIDWGCNLTQIPKVIPTINLGSRLVVFGLLDHGMVSEKLILSGINDSHQPLKWAIPVTERKGNTIHKMAAYNLITELYENEGANKSQIIQLGLKYQLATKFTSFVATAVNENTSAADTLKSQDIILQKPAPVKQVKQKKKKHSSLPQKILADANMLQQNQNLAPSHSIESAYLNFDDFDEDVPKPAPVQSMAYASSPKGSAKSKSASIFSFGSKSKASPAKKERKKSPPPVKKDKADLKKKPDVDIDVDGKGKAKKPDLDLDKKVKKPDGEAKSSRKRMDVKEDKKEPAKKHVEKEKEKESKGKKSINQSEQKAPMISPKASSLNRQASPVSSPKSKKPLPQKSDISNIDMEFKAEEKKKRKS